MVVRERRVLHENLSDDADARLLHIVDGKSIEISDDLFAHLLNLVKIRSFDSCEEIDNLLFPFFMKLVRTSLHFFIGADAVQALHEHIAEYAGEPKTDERLEIYLESWIRLETGEVCADDRNLLHTGLFKSTADKADVIRCTAHTAGLRHDDGSPVRIVFAGFKSFHELAHDTQRRIAGIVVHVLETVVNGTLRRIAEDHKIVADRPHGRFDELEMDRGHLRAEDGVAFLIHFFGERHLPDQCRVKKTAG